MTWQVYAHELVTSGQHFAEAPPQPPGLGEAVCQHQPGAITADLGVQRRLGEGGHGR